MIRTALLLFVVFFLFAEDGFSQTIAGNSILELRKEKALDILPPAILPQRFLRTAFNVDREDDLKKSTPKPGLTSIIPEDNSYQMLGFFCKVEVDVAKAINFPLKFRLGEVHYVERMEGKRGY